MKTVLHIIEHLDDFGGTPRKLLYLAAHHNSETIRHVFVTYQPSSLRETFEQYDTRVFNLNTLSIWRLVFEIIKIARSTKASVISTHYSRPLFIGFLVSRLLRIPFIHNEHSSSHYRKGLARRLARICLPFAERVICNSNYTATTIINAYKLENTKVRVLYNPVESRRQLDSRELVRQHAAPGTDTMVIGHVGGMIATRDQATLLRAFKMLNILHANSRLWLIGDGPLREQLEQLAHELGIEKHVAFLGYTDRIGDYLAAMDIYVNPTIDEGFGIAVVEAMLAGLPVILANAGAHPELIEDNTHGLLYTPASTQALFSSLLTLTEQAEKRHILGKNARARADLHFQPNLYARGYQQIVYESTTHVQSTIPSADEASDKWN